GQHCQSCHMTPTGLMDNIAPGKGGIQRDPHTLGSHGFPGGQKNMLSRCLDVAVTFTSTANGITAAVEVRTKDVGHRVPTGFIDRHLLLIVEGYASEIKRLDSLSGPRLPKAAGKQFAKLPGWIF